MLKGRSAERRTAGHLRQGREAAHVQKRLAGGDSPVRETLTGTWRAAPGTSLMEKRCGVYGRRCCWGLTGEIDRRRRRRRGGAPGRRAWRRRRGREAVEGSLRRAERDGAEDERVILGALSQPAAGHARPVGVGGWVGLWMRGDHGRGASAAAAPVAVAASGLARVLSGLLPAISEQQPQLTQPARMEEG